MAEDPTLLDELLDTEGLAESSEPAEQLLWPAELFDQLVELPPTPILRHDPRPGVPDSELTSVEVLQRYWGYEAFRPLQQEIVEAVLAGRDTLGLMPTGGGKSITFQVPGLMLPGLTLVVTPLISLMKDQVDRLRAQGIRAAAIHSGMGPEQMQHTLDNCLWGGYKFLYISPERLASPNFLAWLQEACISLLAVDECHCISQWGYDFRPSYLNILELRRLYPELPILALTATATEETIGEILSVLDFRPGYVLLRKSFLRPQLSYSIRRCEDKAAMMLHILRRVPGPAILYCRNRELTRQLAEELDAADISATYYHAGLSYKDRELRQARWMRGEVRVMVATNAFGMGIDKPDVRLVLHLTMPSSLEEYFQEAGRAGRDGERAYAVAIVTRRDSQLLQRRLEDSFPPKDYIRHCYDQLCNYLEIGEGEGLGRSYSVDVEHFIRLFHMRPVQTYHALEIMQLARWLRYEEDGGRSRLMFLIPSSQLYQPHIGPDKLIRAILRSYTGLFSSYVSIYEPDLAEATGYTVEEIYEHLARLGRIGVLHYIPQRQVPRVTFLVRREESRLLQISPEAYEERRRRMADRIACVRSYIEAEETCRSRMLLAYFGEEEAVPCGCCDVCLTRHPSGLHQYVIEACREALERLFLTTERPSLPVAELVASLPYPELEVYEALRYWAAELDGLVLDGAHLRREV